MTDWLLDGEPELATDRIQGNVLAGFFTDYQLFVGLRIADAGRARRWLADLAGEITTVDDVLGHRLLARAGEETREPSGVWLNIGVACSALAAVGAPSAFDDVAFREGLARRFRILGDPPSDPAGWPAGGPGEHRLDVLLILAGPPAALPARADELVASARAGGLEESYREPGSTVPGRGIEHFGFRDGVSQPGVLGTVGGAPDRPITRRSIPDERAVPHAGPGKPLVWPGEFVFGYPGQGNLPRRGGPVSRAGDNDETTAFALDGSLLVFRRLRQDVGAFRRFLATGTEDLRRQGLDGMTPERLAALIVGRWPSGAPVTRSPDQDDPDLGADRDRSNDFDFGDDVHGDRCPLAAHIRKVNPRAGPSDVSVPLQKRLLRRGIPYGPFVSENPSEDVDRGLLFLSYQCSIADQFEFLSTDWMNSPRRPAGSGGHDLVVGFEGAEGRRRDFDLPRPGGGPPFRVSTTEEWVLAEGGEYLFAPSTAALASLA
jgi:Dyp-type peroxidase family